MCSPNWILEEVLIAYKQDEFEARGSFAGYPYMVANKVSYHLDLLGPSIPTDNACSSSLTALHLAVQALRSGDCESAVVGGCQLNHRYGRSEVQLMRYSDLSNSASWTLCNTAKDLSCRPTANVNLSMPRLMGKSNYGLASAISAHRYRLGFHEERVQLSSFSSLWMPPFGTETRSTHLFVSAWIPEYSH